MLSSTYNEYIVVFLEIFINSHINQYTLIRWEDEDQNHSGRIHTSVCVAIRH